MAHLSTALMLKAGFTLTECEDGKFWVIEKQAGEEADRVAAACGRIIDDMDGTHVEEDIVLQCGSDYSDPAVYMDGFLWNLPKREFTGIVTRLAKIKK